MRALSFWKGKFVTEVSNNLSQVKIVKQKYEPSLLKKKNVVGVGIGFKMRQGTNTDTLAIVVNVKEKLPLSKLKPDDVVPASLEGVAVDVMEVGEIKPLQGA